MNNTHLALLNSPRGKMIAERDGDVLVGLWFAGQPLAPSESCIFDDASAVPLWVQLQSELDEYFAGEREVFTVEYELRGTQWQKSVWSELERIPAGQTVTYGDIAAALRNEGVPDGTAR